MKVEISDRLIYEGVLEIIKRDIKELYKHPELLRAVKDAVKEYLLIVPIPELMRMMNNGGRR